MIENSKLILLLESFEDREWHNFELFLKSPYFNKDERLVILFQCLKHFHPGISDRFKTKADLFNNAFPKQKYDEKNFRYLMSHLNGLAEQFLGMQQIKKHSLELDYHIMDELSKRHLLKAYQNKERQFEKKIKNTAVSQREKILYRLKLEELKQKHFERSHIRKIDYTVQRISQILDEYYFLYRLHLSCAMLDHQAIFGGSYKINLSKHWIQHLIDKSYFDQPIIQTYFNVYQSLMEEEAEHYFDQLKSYLNQDNKVVFQEDLKDIFLFAINYCARKIRKGKQYYEAEALDLYIKGIETKVLLKEGQLTPWTFTNVVKLAIKLERHSWTQQFITENESKLIPKFRENAVRFCRAELFYAMHQYGLAQSELVKVAHSDLNYYLNARVLLAKIYYKTEETEALLSLIASFTIFLKRNKHISKNIKQAGLNFCNVLLQIVKNNPKSLNRIKEKIEKMDFLTERKWLLTICHEATTF